MRAAVVVSGSVNALAVCRSLAAQGVPVVLCSYDEQDVARSSRAVRETVAVPHPERDEAGFLEALRDVGLRHPGAVLMLASDAALAVVPRHEATLRAQGFLPAWSSAEAAATFLDKASTAALAARAEVPAPVTTVPTGRDDIARFAASGSFPAVVKPLISHSYVAHFGTKWVSVDDEDAAVAEYDRAAAAGFEVLVQEFVPGDETAGANYNAYFDQGRPCVELTAQKIRNWPSDTGSPCVTVSRHLPEVVETGRRLLAAVGFSGYANIEFKQDARDGVYKLMEVNARYNYSSMLSTRCGVNFPWLQYRHLVHGDLPENRAFAEGVHWIDITRDLQAASRHALRSPSSLREIVRPYHRSPVWAVWSWRDPRPAARRAGAAARARVGRLTRSPGA